jgi:hypothetical protein
MSSSFILEEVFSSTEIHVRVSLGVIHVKEVFPYVDCIESNDGVSDFVMRQPAYCLIESIWAYGIYHDELHSGMTARLRVNAEFVKFAVDLLNSRNKKKFSFSVSNIEK